MTWEMSSLDLHFLLKEMGGIIGARLDKIYCPSKKELLIQLFLSGQGKRLLRIAAPGFMYVSEFKPEQAEKPSGFCTLLRKHLDNSRLREIRQIGFERIVELGFEKEERYRLVVELFSKGNIVLCKEDYTIIGAAENQEWRNRKIAPRLKYIFPKKEFDFMEMDYETLRRLIEDSNKSIVKILAVELGLGGLYAEELCLAAGIDKGKEKPEEREITAIVQARDRLLSRPVKPTVYFEGGEIKTCSPFVLCTQEDKEKRVFENFNQALDSIFTPILMSKGKDKKLSKHNSRIEKLKKIVEKQEEHIAELGDEIDESSKKAELIYNNYQIIDGILQELAKARKKYSLKEMKEKLNGHKLVKELKEKDKTIVVELE